MNKITPKEAPNVADVYPWAVSDKIVGVAIFTSAIGLGFRTDKGLAKPTSWKDLADPCSPAHAAATSFRSTASASATS